MKLALVKTLLFLTTASATSTAPDNTLELDARAAAKTNIYVCTDKSWAGTCKNIQVTAGQCYNMPKAFDKNVSSTGPDEGTFCTLYSTRNCRGGKVIPFTNPGIADFTKYQFDNELRSLRCEFIWGWPKKSG